MTVAADGSHRMLMKTITADNARLLIAANRALTALGYVAYPLLLVLLWIFAPWLLTRCVAAPAAGFVVVSVFRYVYNAPRPYELKGAAPLIPKSTKGKSFPSRHTFCMFMIAFTWMTWMPAIGALLAACAVFMGWVRVALGVHFTRDVVAGFATAALFALVGYVVIPW